MSDIINADQAHENYVYISKLRKDISNGFWMLVGELKKCRDNRYWAVLGNQTWASYLAQPEIDFNEHTVDNWITIYNRIKECHLLPPEGVIDIDISKLAVVLPHLTPENGEELLQKAKNLSRSDLREEFRQKRATPELPEGKYNVIYADPPWPYEEHGVSVSENYGGATQHYPTMTIEQIRDLPVKDLATDNSTLFIWVTSPKLNQVWEIINSWGFEYKTSFVWDKVKHNFGYYNSVRHELLLVCGRGSSTPEIAELFDSVQTIERTEKHSEKPEEFRKIIETLYPSAKKIELFAREKHEGWEVWGDEV